MTTGSAGTDPSGDLENLDDQDPAAQDDDTPDDGQPDPDAEPRAPGDEGDPDPSTDGQVTESQQVARLKAEIKELNSRIGSLAQANDTRLKEVEAQWTGWGENYRRWAEEQIAAAQARGREDAEEHFLPLLDSESKAQYLDDSRAARKTREAEQRREREAAAAVVSQQRVAISTAIARATAKGVPAEVLDTSSPEAVTESAMQYLAQGGKPVPKGGEGEGESTAELKRRLDEQDAEIRRLRRDTSGASRTGTGTGGTPANTALRELDLEIEKAKRQHNIMRTVQLKREKEALLAGARK